MVNGARLSVSFGLVTMVIAVGVGVTVGVIAGFFGGWVDGVLMRLVDLMLAIPFLFIILVAASFFGGGDPLVLMLIFGLLSWPVLARLTRALYLSLREQEYVDAARAVGVRDRRIAFRHILPNALGPIIVSATLVVANAIILEAFVSYLGFGVRSTDISWGTALTASQGQLILGNWWWAFFPGTGHRAHGHRHQLHGRRPPRRLRSTGPRMTEPLATDQATASGRRSVDAAASRDGRAAPEDDRLVAVHDLRTYFDVMDGTVRAVDGVSFGVPRGGSIGIVGESGCGKSVTALTVMRLLEMPPARIPSGSHHAGRQGRADAVRRRDAQGPGR